jgi:dihydroorotase/allantoinase
MGNPQYDHLLSVVLTDVNAGKMALEVAVRMLSENPARIIGRYPHKGALLPGSDADLVMVDLEREFVATDAETYTKVHWTPYDGWTLKGKPVLTMLRGQIIARDGIVVGEAGYGHYLEGIPLEPVSTHGYRAPGLALQRRAPAPAREPVMV